MEIPPLPYQATREEDKPPRKGCSHPSHSCPLHPALTTSIRRCTGPQQRTNRVGPISRAYHHEGWAGPWQPSAEGTTLPSSAPHSMSTQEGMGHGRYLAGMDSRLHPLPSRGKKQPPLSWRARREGSCSSLTLERVPMAMQNQL